jgi:hypothetical protein
MPTISKLDGTTLKILRAEMDLALFEVAKKYGVSLTFGNRVTFTDTDATFKLNVVVKNSNGVAVTQERQDFARYATMYNLNPTWLDQTFSCCGKKYKIVGLKLSRKKNPIVAERVDTGRNYKFSIDTVKISMSPVGKAVTGAVSARREQHEEIENRIADMRRNNPEMYYADGEYRASGMSEKQIHDHHYRSIKAELERK